MYILSTDVIIYCDNILVIIYFVFMYLQPFRLLTYTYDYDRVFGYTREGGYTCIRKDKTRERTPNQCFFYFSTQQNIIQIIIKKNYKLQQRLRIEHGDDVRSSRANVWQ
jgi:hypothetical protein